VVVEVVGTGRCCHLCFLGGCLLPQLSHANASEANDVVLCFPGDRYPVEVGPNLRSTGWRGGLWVQYVAGDRDWTVEASDGNFAAGFLLFPSEQYNQVGLIQGGFDVGSNGNWISTQPATGVGGQNVVTMINGGSRTLFRFFETHRLVGGVRTGATITYTLQESLWISENGLLTNDSAFDLGTVGIPNPVYVGMVSAIPSNRNDGRLGLDMKY